MHINLLELMNGKKKVIEIDERVDIKSIIVSGEEVQINKPVELKGRFTKDDDEITLKATLKVELRLSCSACLKNFDKEMEIEIEEKFKLNPTLEDFEFHPIKDDCVELDEILKTNIETDLPIRTLCMEECKGLCASCGCNLNEETCKCVCDEEEEEEQVDPRFAKLQNLFKNR